MIAAAVVRWLFQALGLLVAGTLLFDVVHFWLHRLPGFGFHRAHHAWLNSSLQVDQRFASANFWLHRVPELLISMVGVAVGILFLEWPAVAIAQGVLLLRFALATFRGGRDRRHQSLKKVPAPQRTWLVGPGYHSLHHAYPTRYLSTVFTLFDRLAGTGCQLQGRRVAITGASGAFGGPLKTLLERKGATVTALKFGVDYTYDDYSRCDEALSKADVLVLAHGAKVERAMAANCDSFVHFIERFKALTVDRQLPPEVWAVGSEIECHPSWGNPELEIYLQSKRAFARHARRYFHDPDLLYRHIVPSAFTSPMGKGLISGKLAAAWAWFFICRGFRYIPVSYTGIALLNYFKFVFRVHAVKNPNPQIRRLSRE